MKTGREKYGFLFGLGFLLLMVVVTGVALNWRVEAGSRGSPKGPEKKDWSAVEAAARKPKAERPQDSFRDAAAHRWDVAESVGEEGEEVEVVYEEGWQLVGERVRGLKSNGVPPFQVPARKVEDIPMFPCSECHKGHNINNRKRKLKKEHADIKLTHGDGRFWCNGCHDGGSMDLLSTIDGRLVDMDLGYLLCGQCHFREMKDWQHGAHGKRIGFWAGVRVFRTCTECHNAHAPAIVRRVPDGPPSAPEGKPPSYLHSEHDTKMMRHLANGRK